MPSPGALPGVPTLHPEATVQSDNGQRLIRSERILACRQRLQLVELPLHRQMRSLAPHIRNIDDKRVRQFALHSETPLLRIGPDRLGRNRSHIQRKNRTAAGWRRVAVATRLAQALLVGSNAAPYPTLPMQG